jgi:hypothetical protein
MQLPDAACDCAAGHVSKDMRRGCTEGVGCRMQLPDAACDCAAGHVSSKDMRHECIEVLRAVICKSKKIAFHFYF